MVSGRREFRSLGNRDNKWVWAGLCVFFSFFLLPYLTKEAFSDSFLNNLAYCHTNSFCGIFHANIPIFTIDFVAGNFQGSGIEGSQRSLI